MYLSYRFVPMVSLCNGILLIDNPIQKKIFLWNLLSPPPAPPPLTLTLVLDAQVNE
jgi:hypothetical protein